MEINLPILKVSGPATTEIFNYYDEIIYKMDYTGVNPDLLYYAGTLIYNYTVVATF